MTYPRTYIRPCRECHRPILGAARNQRLHADCRARAAARRLKLRRQCRRAALGMFPFDRVSLERMVTGRHAPTPATRRRYYAWRRCAAPACGKRFFAGKDARWCVECLNARRRARNHRYWIRRKARLLAAPRQADRSVCQNAQFRRSPSCPPS